MRLSRKHSAAALLLFVDLASLVNADALKRRDQAAQCSHPGGVNGIESSCWDLLNMTAYTKSWWSRNSAKCGAGANFSTCFWELHNLGTTDCTGVKPGACPVPRPTGFTAQDWYIAYNIYAINQVFYSLYMAIGNANTLASETVGAIVALLDPPKNTNVFVNDLLTALAAGVGILPGGTPIRDFLVRVANQPSPVGKYLFPVGTAQSQVTQWSSIANQLGTVAQWYQSNVSEIIPVVNNNVDNFIDFASTGLFSVNPLPDLSDESDNLLKGLTTYIVSLALTANNVVVGRAVDTDVAQLQQNSSDNLAFNTGCGSGYDSNGICSAYWFDSKTKTTYSLDNLGDIFYDFHDTMGTLFDNWTTGDLLFTGAARCLAQGGTKPGGLATTVINSAGNVSVDCLSNIKICTWDMNSLDVEHEFTDCPSQTDYIVKGCGNRNGCENADGALMDVTVPHGYLGAYLQDSNGNTCVCN